MRRALLVRWLVTGGCVGAVVVACAAEHQSGSAELPDGVEAISFLGDTLRPPALDSSVRARREGDLARAQAAHDAAPQNADSMIWLGRRLAYLARYRDAIEAFTAGVRAYPEDARFRRHRGHRYITTRRLDLAVGDFEAAARLVSGRPDEIEPDGMPNNRGIPTSTLQFNIWYHLGLARYLKGELEQAVDAYRQCLAVSVNPDMQVATTHWLYMALRRLGRAPEAAAVLEPIRRDMDIVENQAYHRMLLMYRSALPVDSLLDNLSGPDAVENATVGYGIANWYLYNGNEDEAERIFRRILQGPEWAAFGYIAAEADLARLLSRSRA